MDFAVLSDRVPRGRQLVPWKFYDSLQFGVYAVDYYLLFFPSGLLGANLSIEVTK